MLRVYVIASYQSAPQVRAIHDRLRMAGIEPTSSWAEEACGAEDLARKSDEECSAIWRRNDQDMHRARLALVLADTPCREGFHEAGRALRSADLDVVWVGRPTLSARMMAPYGGVWFCEDIDAAVAGLAAMARAR